MNFKPENLGAEPKKLAVLGGLVLVAAYFFFSNSHSESPAPVRRPPAGVTAVSNVVTAPVERAPRRSVDGVSRDSLADWRPSVKRKKDFDPTRIDPTLKLALLEKLRAVPLEGGQRSLFDFSQEPVKEAVIHLADTHKKGMPPVHATEMAAKPPEPPAAPVAPPIPLKFYGFVSATEAKRAFFLDGDDIVVAREGDVIKKRYKVMRIGLNSAIVEDEQFKSQQTLTLVQEQQEG
ncbi:MAG TPA: hypothetical protein VLT57_00555 [Bryobacteraceae bacterium]|nr:hypothetical protein [Bryobacteraceae bacterium]